MAARGDDLPVLAGRERAQPRLQQAKQTRGGAGVPSLPETRLVLESLLLWCESRHHLPQARWDESLPHLPQARWDESLHHLPARCFIPS